MTTLRIRIKNGIHIEARNTDNEIVAEGERDVSDNVLLIPDTNYTVKDQDDNVLGTGNLVSCKTGQEIEVTVDGTVTAETTDRYGISLPNKIITPDSPQLNWNGHDFTPLMLSREASWGGFETNIQNASNGIIAAGLWPNLISMHYNIGGTAGCHRWNVKYPYDFNVAQRMLYSGITHSAKGLGGLSGFTWAFPNVNVQSFANSYNIAIGVALTDDLGTALGTNKQLFNASELTGVSANLQINTTTGNISYRLFNGSATYVPGAPESDYTGMRYVVMRDGTNLKLFINGTLVQTTTPAFSLQISSYTINSTLSFGGQGSAGMGAETKIGNIYIARDLTNTNVATIDGIILTLETAVR